MESSPVPNILTCGNCRTPVAETFFFCPVCGKKVREKPASVSLMAQLAVYAISLFLPPLGLIYTVKYLKQPEAKAKTVGWITLLLTVISIVITLKITMDLLTTIKGTINMQMPNYGNLGL